MENCERYSLTASTFNQQSQYASSTSTYCNTELTALILPTHEEMTRCS